MAPDSWKGLYESTLQHVKDGTIAIERLDDAVRRILRVKLLSGIFQKGAPSTRANAGNENLLALPEHRDVARQAVRESLVLLKNNNQLLPIDPSKTILVVGDGASSISKASGGWTLSWQGTGHSNDKFPNGESILQGIEKIVDDAGGKLIFSKDGDTSIKADVVIAVYGEDPYAEFQGDRENLAFIPNGFDTKKLSTYKENGIPIVSVFLSGRPMWANTEINNSDSFVAAWLPGSEGGGISDMLFKTDPSFDFTGRLSFTWPASAVVSKNNNQALFKIGYGLSYTSTDQIDFLSENSGLENSEIASTGEYFNKGDVVAPWDIWLISGELEKQIASFPSSVGGLIISKTDHMAQEDALRINWTKSDGDYFRISSVKPNDLTRQSNGAMKLAFNAKSFTGSDSTLQIGQCDDSFNCDKTLEIKISGEWKEYLIPLSNFEELGIDMSKIISSILIKAEAGVDIGLSNVRLE
jgi:beta-glucosidase